MNKAQGSPNDDSHPFQEQMKDRESMVAVGQAKRKERKKQKKRNAGESKQRERERDRDRVWQGGCMHSTMRGKGENHGISEGMRKKTIWIQ